MDKIKNSIDHLLKKVKEYKKEIKKSKKHGKSSKNIFLDNINE